MSTATDITFPRDKNHEAIPVLAHDFSSVVGGCVMLAGSSYAIDENSIYRLVGSTDMLYHYGNSTAVALCNFFGLNSVRLPPDQIEYLFSKNGQTSLAVSSDIADGGCFNLIRMR